MLVENSPLIADAAQGGAMARLIGAHDWAATPLGPQASWPRPLQTTVDLMLSSQFPMFVAWGAERCFIYNDAYSHILGNKHPHGLGKPFRVVWNDIWDAVGPIADRAFANQPSYFHDLPIQMERNGYSELTYFTFSYSGVRGEGGGIDGMFCVCQETTAAVVAAQRHVDEMDRLRQLFQKAPGFMALLRGPQHVFEMTNAAYQQLTGGRNLLGKTVREALPELAGQGFYELLDNVYRDGMPYVGRGTSVILQRQPGAALEDVVVNFVFQPFTGDDGAINGVFIEGSDVTEQYLAQQELASNIARLEQVERRQAFQLELSDRIRDLDKPEEITAAASEILGRCLAVDRVVYVEVDEAAGTFVVGRQWCRDGVAEVDDSARALDIFGPRAMAQLRAGDILAIDDVNTDPLTAQFADAYAKLGVGANLGVPLVKSGRLVAVLNLHRAAPCAWSDSCIAQARETVERTWAALQSARAHVALKAERDQAEAERRLLDALLEAVPVGIGMSDTDGNLVRVNRANRQVWGDALPLSGDIAGCAGWKGWWADGSSRHGQALAPHEWALSRVLRGEDAPNDMVEIESFDAPGQRRTIVLSAAAVRDADGRIAGGVVAQMDVTARQEAERALRASEAKFRTITNAMPHMVFSALPDGRHDYFNQQWYTFTGVAEGVTFDANWLQAFHADDQPRAVAQWRDSLASGAPYEIEFRLRHRSGQYRWVLARALPIRDEGGSIVRWMGSATDIHDQKQTQDALRLADRRKDEFLAMLAHELRNPLAPISAGADLLRLTRVDEARVRQISELISRQVKHMTSLVDDLMDVSRVTRGLITLDNAMLDARHIVTDAVEQVRPLIDTRGHQLVVHAPPESAFVMGDQKRLIQVITNVLNNAAKYTPQGGRIVLKMEASPGEVVISVADNGIGMVADMVGRVFELFTQAERTSDRSQGGLGIGLALVNSLVELHHGTVTAASAGPEQGSEFTIRLPRVVLPVATAELAGDGPPPPAGTALRVMVVDDNNDAAMMLGMFLESAGHQVSIEHNAGRALQSAQHEQPDVYMLDIGLPDMDGNELARLLRAQPGGQRAVLIAITGYGQEQDRQQTAAAGFDHHYVKPVDAEQLLTLLAAMKRPR
ncbi:PAS domain S-box protein [Massilia sp. TWR1-2-2]|uniref:PAS domain S-box protein n=1 Tax=Massilia sp. TWR1-2-2 TaxID=2804584 RepID=UPI003CFA1DFF